ncbi:MAG TPA: hypothetical protein VF658_12120 [Pyrinomonadaceae bacterium]|jgi:hypothetical protein
MKFDFSSNELKNISRKGAKGKTPRGVLNLPSGVIDLAFPCAFASLRENFLPKAM